MIVYPKIEIIPDKFKDLSVLEYLNLFGAKNTSSLNVDDIDTRNCYYIDCGNAYASKIFSRGNSQSQFAHIYELKMLFPLLKGDLAYVPGDSTTYYVEGLRYSTAVNEHVYVLKSRDDETKKRAVPYYNVHAFRSTL